MEENLTDNQPATFEIVPGGTTCRKPQLHSSDGYIYTTKAESVTYLTCSIRQKNNKCPTSVI